jgi:carbamoyl-phosphate synthase large subunit
MLDKYGVELIGAKLPSIDRAEDRELFKQSMKRIGLSVSIAARSHAAFQGTQTAASPLLAQVVVNVGSGEWQLTGGGGAIAWNQMESFNRPPSAVIEQ